MTFDVSCFGEVLWDIFDVDTKAEPGGRTFRRELGGAPANLATTIARLGLSSAIVGAVGKDAFGDALAKHLESDGVDIKHLARRPERTGIAFITRSDKGEPNFLFYRQATADTHMTADDVAVASAKARFGVVGTSTLLTEELTRATYKFLDGIEKNKGVVVVDLNVRAHLWDDEATMKSAIAKLARRAAIIKASESDLKELAGKRGMTWLEENAKGATWILTRGENGAAAVGAHGQVTAPTKRVRCADATGAGDAFLAGVLAVLTVTGAEPKKPAWADPKIWTRALDVGHMLGAKAVSQVGAVAGLSNLEDVATKLSAAKKG